MSSVSAVHLNTNGATAPPALQRVSTCRVEANGVPVEWVEAAVVATAGQPTFVYFIGGRHGARALEHSRRAAGDLAVTTGARVLTVACRGVAAHSRAAAVQRGVAAYVWLLGEGCDLDNTTFRDDAADHWLVTGITGRAGNRGVPVPISCSLRGVIPLLLP